jgi:adenylate cyclase
MAPRSAPSIFIFAAALAVGVVAAQLLHFGPAERVELAIQDALARAGRPAPVDPDLVFLAVDTASASLDPGTDLGEFLELDDAPPESRRALELMAHEWPWSCEVHGLVLDRLVQAGARAVVFDFTFPKPSPNDDAFRAMLDRHRDRVVVACNVAEDHSREDAASAATIGVPAPTLIPPGMPRDARVGFDNFWPDADEVVRRATYRWAQEAGVWRSPEDLSLASRALQRAGRAEAVVADREPQRMRFAGPAGTFAPHPIYEIFVPKYWRQNFGGGAALRDKIVVIGASGNWQQDVHLTPLGMMPGPELHLNAINAALHRAFVRETPAPLAAALALGAALGAAFLRRQIRRGSIRFGVQLGATVGWGVLALVLFDRADVFLPVFAPLLCFNLTGIGGLVLDIVVERREKAHLRRTLERYVSRNVVEELVDDRDGFSRALGGEVRHVTVLFSDVRGFTTKAHEMNSQELVAQLNEYFSAMVECVFRFGGTLDKFIGDAVMAVWGNARSAGPAADARAAVACGLAMFEELARLNARWAAQGRPQFQIGVGINSGPVVVGNIGSPQRMEFTVIGDAVNVAWRLQEKTKDGHRLLLGEVVLPLLGAEFSTEVVGHIHPRGDEPVAYARLVEREPVPAGRE